jgi:DNA-binding NtrC family response regulator
MERLTTVTTINGGGLKADLMPGMLLGESPVMQDLKKQIDRVAATSATVLITGESGSGKELVARTIHEYSDRASGPFIAINCAAIPESLIEAELFGHEKGSFTGAVKSHQGVFERARGGTLLLDEISEMSIAVQSRLLRVLQNYRFYRVGGSEELSTDVRIIAATNCNLVAAVHAHEFRADLLYRLAVFPIKVPPLRTRGDDIVLLALHFLEQLNASSGERKRFAPGTEEFLRAHEWPGNVRELRNCIERGFIMSDDEVELDSSLLMPLAGAAPDDAACIPVRIGSRLADVERQLIVATLDRFGGNKRHAAEVLGCSVKTLYNKLHLYQAADGQSLPHPALS